MLLTLKPPLQNGFTGPHAYSTPPPTSTSQPTPTPTGLGSFPPLPAGRTRRMSTPLRGLPPPAAMTLQNADRGQPLGQLPAPPAQWQGADESMRNWLQAKAEEDSRKQEEERTRQESLRLEQRKIEQTMLRESLQGGVPPYMVPMVFAGMGGGNLPNASLEWAQHYMAQISLQQQQQQLEQQQQQQALPQQTPPELRRDDRMVTGPQPNPYATLQPIQQATAAAPVQAGQQLPSQPQQSSGFVHSYQLASTSPAARAQAQQLPLQASGPTSAPRPQPQSQLPRLNTNELRIQQPPQGPQGAQVAGQTLHPLQQAQSAQQQEQQSSSPNIFLHWMPPTSQAGSNQPMTPSGKSQQESPFSQSTGSHLRSDYAPSPKKRKTGTNQTNSTPSSQAQETSPSFSQTSSSSTPSGRRGAHSRQRSDASNRRYDALGRPTSRQRQQESVSAPSSGQTASTPQQTPATTVSEDQNRQASAQPETRQPCYSAGPEMRRGQEASEAPKHEGSRS